MRSRLSDEQGFTLIELLVVILIIGILAAVALPNFLGQRAKGQDASAKSNARSLVSHIESCFATSQEYDLCNNTALTNTGLQVPAGDSAAPTGTQVSVTAADDNTYTIVARSQNGNTFAIQKQANGTVARSCSVPSGNDLGACNGATAGGTSGTW